MLIIMGLIALLVGVGLWRRQAERRRPLPCPSWLSWLLENPYMQTVAGSSVILKRIDLAPGMRVLDVGCGPGRIAIPVAKAVGTSGQVVALDIQPAMLRKLEKRIAANGITNIQTVLGAIGQGVLEQNAFDRALLVTVLGEITDQEAALREIYRALKAGGILSVTEVIPDPDYQSRRTVKRLCQAAGFQLDSVHGSWLAFTMNFVKPHS
ncbi:MAG: class I SAM-dependent methyltransferase [candidate division KSB1 bacterium]|nr:class I SAM-dependent methyltransferase [candidate division KSB1 bacterium]